MENDKDLESQETDDQENEDGQDQDNGESQDQDQDGASDEKKDKKPAEEGKDKGDQKEHNRQGFQKRQEQKQKAVTRDEFDNLNKTVSSIAEENKDLKFRNGHPEITDEEFNSIKAQSKATGKDYEDVLKNDPIVSGYFKNKDNKARIDRATAPPSTRSGSGNSSPDWQGMSSAEFQSEKNKILTRR